VYASRNRDTSVSRARMYCSFRSRWVLRHVRRGVGFGDEGIVYTAEPGDLVPGDESRPVCYQVWDLDVLEPGHLGRSLVCVCVCVCKAWGMQV
jgi:hypothetical protein